MKKYLFLLLLSFLLSESALSQGRVSEARTHLENVITAYNKAEYNKALEYANEALHILPEVSGKDRLLADSLRERALAYKANVFLNLARSDSAILMVEQMEKNGFVTSTFRFRAYLFLLAAVDIQNRDGIRRAHFKALEALKDLEDTEEKTYILQQRGEIAKMVGLSFFEVAKYDSAIFYYEKALQHFENADFKGEALEIKFYLGVVLSEASRRESAEKYFNEVVEQSPDNGVFSIYKIRAFTALLSLYTNNGIVRKDLLEKAEKVFSNLENSIDNPFEIHQIASDLAGHASVCEEFSKALFYNEKARKAAEKTSFHEEFGMHADQQHGLIMRAMGRNREAIVAFKKALPIAKKIQRRVTQHDLLMAIAQLEEESGNYKEALTYYKEYQVAQDSLAGEKLSEIVTKHETAFRTEQKEKENLLLKEQNKTKDAKLEAKTNQNIILFLGFIILCLVVLLVWRVQRLQKKLISELKFKNEEIKTQSEELKQINEELNVLYNFRETMTGMLAHDIKNPVNTILHLTKLSSVKQAGNQIMRLVNNLLDVQKFEEAAVSVRPEVLNLDSIVEEAFEDLRGSFEEKGIKPEIDIQEAYLFEADRELMVRVLENLLSNAVKFCFSRVILRAHSKTDSLLVYVEDDGSGIPVGERSFIFEKFYQAEARKSGKIRATGLGLAFCKMAVEAHGGNISAEESKDLGGARFVISLPLKSRLQRSEPEQVFEPGKHFYFTEEDRNTLAELYRQLENDDVYMYSEIILKAEKGINHESPAQREWLESLKQVLTKGDEEQFKKLLTALKI